jgi:hypothetical protein
MILVGIGILGGIIAWRIFKVGQPDRGSLEG